MKNISVKINRLGTKISELKPRMEFKKIVFALLLFGYLIGCKNTIVNVPVSPYPISNDSFTVTIIAEDFIIPYGIAIVNENEYFITDRIGKLFHFKENHQIKIEGTPKVTVFGDPGLPAIMHGGLMDVSIHPKFTDNSWIYISYLNADGFAEVSRFKVHNNAVIQLETIFKTRNKNYYGNGMRIVWEDDTHFFLNVGGSTLSTATAPNLISQDLSHDAGKIHRLNDDGSIPTDNPIFVGFTLPITIWSYGHRDVQGLVYDDVNNILLGIEHGPKGGDEFNIIEAGGNYGWPLFTYGINYDGAVVSTITKEEAAQTTILPEYYWTVPTDDGGQAIAPACLLKVEGSNIADWNNHFLLGSLAFRRLMKYNRETKETYGLNIEGRVRTIKQLPSGDIIALIERNDVSKANGKIVRISN